MTSETELQAELKVTLGDGGFMILGNDETLFLKLKSLLPMGLTGPNFSQLLLHERLYFSGDQQIKDHHLTAYLQLVFRRYKELIPVENAEWLIAGDGFTENSYQVSKEDLIPGLEVFLTYPHAVIVVPLSLRSGVHFGLDWSANIFAFGERLNRGTHRIAEPHDPCSDR